MLVLDLVYCHSLPSKLEQSEYMPSRHPVWPNIARLESVVEASVTAVCVELGKIGISLSKWLSTPCFL